MPAPAKFLFDTDFGRGKPGAASAAQHQAALAEAEARGFRKGHAAGRAEAEAETARTLADAMAAAAAALDRLSRSLHAVEARMETEAVEVAVAVASKLAGELIRREPFAEIAALAADCFRHLVGAPHVVVRVGGAVFEEARTRLEEIAAACGFGGRLVVLAEPGLEAGDCRIEWADGGAIRDRAAVQAAIAEAVERYLAVRRASTDGTAPSGIMP
ncbi:MAG: flagellar assembly protein FliH [Variibacter sp.]|nr:flagellar assembly protein FliH [Variibacter sp.]